MTLHFVLAGEGTLAAGSKTRPLAHYSLALVEPGLKHTILGGKSPRPRDTTLVVACGHMRARYARQMDVFAAMPDVVVLDFSDTPMMRSIFEKILDESTLPRPGS